MNAKVAVLKDEALGGIEREYAEVKRKARVGERIKIVNEGTTFGKYGDGDIKTILKVDGDGDAHFTVTPDKDGGNGELFANLEEYVVLEPTDIVRVNGERHRMVERKATAGERITPIIKRPYVTLGKTYTVTEMSPSEEYPVYAHFIDDEGDRWHLPHSDYRVLETIGSAHPTPIQPSEPSIADQLASITVITDGLTDTVAKLTLKLAELETQVKAADGKRKELTRDDLIERAKADVQSYTGNVRFRINNDRRTVACDVLVGGKRERRGIAKAAPGDVFNTHIGRVIALRRALGLEVPTEYTNAPQPSEPRVGDIVQSRGGSINKIVRLTSHHMHYNDGYCNSIDLVTRGHSRIIDDSREEVAQ